MGNGLTDKNIDKMEFDVDFSNIGENISEEEKKIIFSGMN